MKKNTNVILTLLTIFVLFPFFIISAIALDDPEYTDTVLAGHAFEVSEVFYEGEVVRIEYEITGGTGVLHLYIRNSTGDIVRNCGDVSGYGVRYFYVLYDDMFKIIFKNNALLTSRNIELNIDVVKTITITSPISTDTFLSGYNSIVWTSTGDFDYVQIDLYKDGVFLESLGWTDNDGSYSWYIYPDDYEDGIYYQIKISDYDDASIYDYSDYFTIETETKTITITTPKSTDTFLSRVNSITWTTIGDISHVRIDLYRNGVFLETISYYENNDGTYSWYLSSSDTYDGNNYRIRISDYHDASIYDYSDYFTIEIEQGASGGVHSQLTFWGVLLFIIIPVVVVLTIAVVLIHRRRKRIPKEIIPITREVPVKEEPVKAQERELPRITYCSSCGAEVLDRTGDFCSKCGTPYK